jgi:hypothetical protein
LALIRTYGFDAARGDCRNLSNIKRLRRSQTNRAAT